MALVSLPASPLEQVPFFTCLQSRLCWIPSRDISYLQTRTGQIPRVDRSDFWRIITHLCGNVVPKTEALIVNANANKDLGRALGACSLTPRSAGQAPSDRWGPFSSPLGSTWFLWEPHCSDPPSECCGWEVGGNKTEEMEPMRVLLKTPQVFFYTVMDSCLIVQKFVGSGMIHSPGTQKLRTMCCSIVYKTLLFVSERTLQNKTKQEKKPYWAKTLPPINIIG